MRRIWPLGPRRHRLSYSWNGLYWGVNIGYSWGESKNDVTLQVAPGVFGTASASREVNGVIGGFQSGYNYQFGQWVWGFETDFQASGQKGSEVLQITAGDPHVLEHRSQA